MHEWRMTEELVGRACAEAKDSRINRIARIQVELGEASHITEESLRSCFQLLSERTMAEGAELEVRSSSGSDLTLTSLEGD